MSKLMLTISILAFICMTPLIAQDNRDMNIDRLSESFANEFHNLPEKFTENTGAIASIFVHEGDDFVRIATSMKTESGEKAHGTKLGKSHPAYQNLVAGKTFSGIVTVFGKTYMTKYTPIKNDEGKTLAVLFVGITQ